MRQSAVLISPAFISLRFMLASLQKEREENRVTITDESCVRHHRGSGVLYRWSVVRASEKIAEADPPGLFLAGLCDGCDGNTYDVADQWR